MEPKEFGPGAGGGTGAGSGNFATPVIGPSAICGAIGGQLICGLLGGGAEGLVGGGCVVGVVAGAAAVVLVLLESVADAELPPQPVSATAMMRAVIATRMSANVDEPLREIDLDPQNTRPRMSDLWRIGFRPQEMLPSVPGVA
jgi:hypothetical protein